MEMVDEKYLEIQRAVQLLKIEHEFAEIKDDILLNGIRKIFVNGNPRVWWLSLKYEPSRLKAPESEYEYLEISKYFDLEEESYFITELDNIHLFKAKIKNIQNVIGECSFFEYYIVNKKLEKFICETDHGDLLYVDRDKNKKK